MDNTNTHDSIELLNRRKNACIEIMGVFQDNFDGILQSHPGTVISAASRLAGTSLFRSMKYKQKPKLGTVILSEEVNQLGNKLIQLLLLLLKKKGLNITANDINTEISQEIEPKTNLINIQSEFQQKYNNIMKKYEFDYLEGAKTGIIVCAMLIDYHCVQNFDLDPKDAIVLVTKGIIEGSKTVPPPLSE